MHARHSRFSHPVPLGTPLLDYGAMDVPMGSVGVTQKGSVWFPPTAGAATFQALWAEDDWNLTRTVRVSELQRYKNATVKTFPETYLGQREALAFAAKTVGKAPAPPPASAPAYAPMPTAPGYAPMPPAAPGAAAPGTQPPATQGGGITQEAWFWPAVIGGGIGLVALAWAFLPAQSAPKVIIRKAASRFTGF